LIGWSYLFIYLFILGKLFSRENLFFKMEKKSFISIFLKKKKLFDNHQILG